jgi:PAS domain S-box-containing protein
MEIADAKEKGGISYISIAPVRGIGWSVIVGQEKKAILKSLSGYFTRSAAIGFVIFFFLTFCLFYFRREYKYAKAKEIIQAEEKCRNIIENAAEGIFQTTPEGLYISVNPALARMFGYESPEELISTITDVGSQIYAYSEDRDKAVELMRKYGFIKDYNVRCRRKNGSLIWVSFNVHIVRDDQGSILYHEGTSQDITDRKQTEEALRQSEENFRQSFDNSPMGVRIVTREGETIYANRAILDIYGYDSIEEIRTTPAKKRYTPESHADFLIRREKREQGIDVPSEYTINIIRKDGEVRCLLVLRREILWDGERQFQVIYQDITDRKLVEEDLRASEEKYRAVVEDLTELICRFLPGGTLTFVNDAYCRYFGKDKTALVGSSFLSLIPEEDQQAIARMQALISKESPIVTHEHRVILSDGQVLWQQWTNRGIYDGQNHLLEYQAVGRDITERKRAEDNFQVSQQQLRALAKRLQQIREEDRIAIAREIHDEMGGGLTGLKMDLSWLLRKMSNADSGKERVALMDKIHTSNVLIDHMIRVVRRISAHLRPSVLDDLGLIAALEWQLSEFTSRTEIPHELTTTFEYVNMEEATTIAVFRIFQEALTNVARHSRATKVVVDLREGERSLFGDESFVLEIRDNGKGITEEEILNPGSLGLLGMKERVLTFGGELSIRGEPGGGTALVLKIPRKQGETI